MAKRIKGITVEIGGDTTKLSKALESVNKNIKNTQIQLKDVEKLRFYFNYSIWRNLNTVFHQEDMFKWLSKSGIVSHR